MPPTSGRCPTCGTYLTPPQNRCACGHLYQPDHVNADGQARSCQAPLCGCKAWRKP